VRIDSRSEKEREYTVDVDKTIGKLEERAEITSNAWTEYQLGE
jgi:hypothetical protein